MTRPNPSAQATLSLAGAALEAAPSARAVPNLGMSGGWLVLARAVWGIVALLILIFFLANLPFYFAQLQVVCLHPHCAPWQLTPSTAQAIRQIHLSPTRYALVSLVLSVACVSVWFAVAAVIVWRQSRQGQGLLTSLLLVVQCIIQLNASFATPLEYSAPTWHTALVVEVVDDGMGLPERPRAGVGLGSMRERAAELGGECSIGPGPEGGTRVVAVLPLAP